MRIADIPTYRLINQQIAGTNFKTPQEIVAWMGAMQAQEFPMAKWAIGLRLPAVKESDIETAFNEGSILRTHLLRPTWHFVTPMDIRWMLALTAPRVHAFNSSYYRKSELDNRVLKRSNNALAKMLQGGRYLNRHILRSGLEQAKIPVDGLRFTLLLMHAELDGIICSGPRQGNQFTYALLDERVPSTPPFHREEALAELTHRYFSSRGPATIQDFVWWSGLTVKEAREGVAMLKSRFVHEIIEGQTYIFQPAAIINKHSVQSTFLMPDYDEYGISYKDRSAIFNNKVQKTNSREGNSAYSHMIVVNGQVSGTWQRIVTNNAIDVNTIFFSPLSKIKQQAIKKAVKKYISFVGQAKQARNYI